LSGWSAEVQNHLPENLGINPLALRVRGPKVIEPGEYTGDLERRFEHALCNCIAFGSKNSALLLRKIE